MKRKRKFLKLFSQINRSEEKKFKTEKKNPGVKNQIQRLIKRLIYQDQWGLLQECKVGLASKIQLM